MSKIHSNFDTLNLSDYIEKEKDDKNKSKLLNLINNDGITPYFQPIIDLFTLNIHGYEILSRGSATMFSPEELFSAANKFDLEWELEYACRKAALKKISTLSKEYDNKYFFLNVSPKVFYDKDFQSGFTVGYIREYGINPNKIVLEITETATIEHYDIFEKLINHYVQQGFQIALDDFGAGHSGLTTLVTITPHFMKIDKDIIIGISDSPYKQKLLKTLCHFASDVGSNVLAEGIESFNDFEIVYKLGVRYAQGFYLGRPSPFPNKIVNNVKADLHKIIQRYKISEINTSQFLNDIVNVPQLFQVESITCKELDLLFRLKQQVDHVVILEDETPTLLITREKFYRLLSGRFGFAVHANHLVEKTFNEHSLILKNSVDLLLIKKIALSRNGCDTFDPIIIINDDETFEGTIIMKDLIEKAIDLEVLNAVNQNPLTKLPGNNAIKRWLNNISQSENFTIVYIDIDQFKQYNDKFGFSNGDKMITLVSDILKETALTTPFAPELGHIGGDDFILIFRDIISDDILDSICEKFDKLKVDLFSDEEIKNRHYRAKNRQGKEQIFPITTISLAAFTSNNFNGKVNATELSHYASDLKSIAKKMSLTNGHSSYIYEQRYY